MNESLKEPRLSYIDISPLVGPKTAVFPGDQPFERKVVLDFTPENNLQLSSILTTVHIGAHTDAPIHYHRDGEAIHTRDLNYYLGPCQVVHVLGVKDRIKPEHLPKGFKLEAKRILFRTDSFPNPNLWQNEFASFSPELIELLVKQGAILVGIDTPSIDPHDSKLLESHNTVFRNDLAILEGIVLTEVEAGLYTLIALPLPIEKGDASPVRAILLKGSIT